MPLSEAPQTQKGKQQVFSHGDEIFELLCSKGQIFVQKSSLSIASPQSQQVLSKDAPEPANPVVRRFGTIESDSSTNNLIPNEEIVSWMNYPVDDSLRNDCSSDFLPEMSCGHLSGLHRNTIMVNLDPESRSNQISCVHCKSIQASGNSWEFGDGNFDRTKFHNSRVSSISQFVENFSSDHKTGVCGGKGEIHQSSCQKLNASSERNTNSKSLKQTDTQSNNDDHNDISLINFSHFSRPAALVKATLRSSISASSDFPNNRLGIDNKASLTSTDPSGSVLVETNCRARMVPDRHCRPELGNLKKTATNDQGKLNPCPKNVSGANDGLKNEGSSNGTKCYGSNFAVNGGENVMETLMLSSVCSGSSCGGKSSDNINKLRKKDEAEESYHSEDAEDESGDARKAVGTGAKAKRKRAAEVHNLSERRRRDRINEKMRALQELIPNCNKVDKASMLDEAIEYLKNLQMQVQMLSMGNGLCIPSMMFNTGMSPISTPLMAQLGPVGMGMNMASNYWMGMYDMSMHRSQLPYQPISGFTGLVGMQRPNLPFFGMQGQGVPVPMPSAPYLPFAGFPANAMELQTSNHKSDSKN